MARCSAFGFDDVSAAEPTEFELYYRAGEHEYRYILSVHADEIVSEGLWQRKLGASRTATLFEREGAEVVLGPTLRKLATAATFNPSLPYLSFLCFNFDAPVVKEAASWFLGGVFLNYNSSYLERALEQMLDEADSPEVTRFLRAVDVRIDGFRVEKAPEGRGQRVFVKHEVDGKGYELRLSEESAGTQKLMGLAAFLLAALERGGTVVVDELDAKLHPKLLRYVILLFKDPEVNKHGAQLIFSSQDVSTMRNDVFRRDEIWFAARGKGEASQLWSLADIHEANGNLVSKNAAFDKQYLSGRYGADPYLTRIEEWTSMAAKKGKGLAQRQARGPLSHGPDDAPPRGERGQGDRAPLLRGRARGAGCGERPQGRHRRQGNRQAYARPARLRRRALPLRARDVRPRVARARQGRLPGGRLRRDGAQARRALRRVEDVPCAVVEPLLRAVAAPAPALHDRAHDGRRLPARPRVGDVEGPGRRVPQEPRRAVRHGGRPTGRGAASRATSGSVPWGAGQR